MAAVTMEVVAMPVVAMLTNVDVFFFLCSVPIPRLGPLPASCC